MLWVIEVVRVCFKKVGVNTAVQMSDSDVDICDAPAATKCFSVHLCALLLGVIRLILRGRDVVPDFALSLCARGFETVTFSR